MSACCIEYPHCNCARPGKAAYVAGEPGLADLKSMFDTLDFSGKTVHEHPHYKYISGDKDFVDKFEREFSKALEITRRPELITVSPSGKELRRERRANERKRE